LIPPRIYAEMKTVDSMLHRKDSAYLIAKGYIKLVKETIEVDATTEQEIMDQLKKEKDDQKKKQQQKEESDNKIIIKPEAILPAEKKKPEVKDTAI